MRGSELNSDKGFIGLLVTMFSGAANDNLVKTAFIVAITALSWDVFALNAVILANIAALCFVLPFIVLAGFSAHQANVQRNKAVVFRKQRHTGPLELIAAALPFTLCACFHLYARQIAVASMHNKVKRTVNSACLKTGGL